MTADTPSIRPQSERLALGAASRLLGVDPDTLRRWADEGRVPAFTTPGGHRRFDRTALEGLVAARQTGPSGVLAEIGVTPDRLSATYRRRYAERHGAGLDPRTFVPEHERGAYRDAGGKLVDALVRHLDSAGPTKAHAERQALDVGALLGEQLGLRGVTLSAAVSMFVSARQPFLVELGVLARRRGVNGAKVGEIFDASTGLLDRVLLAFIAGHELGAEIRATLDHNSTHPAP